MSSDKTPQCGQCQFFLKGECTHFVAREERFRRAETCPAFNGRPPEWGFFIKF